MSIRALHVEANNFDAAFTKNLKHSGAWWVDSE